MNVRRFLERFSNWRGNCLRRHIDSNDYYVSHILVGMGKMKAADVLDGTSTAWVEIIFGE